MPEQQTDAGVVGQQTNPFDRSFYKALSNPSLIVPTADDQQPSDDEGAASAGGAEPVQPSRPVETPQVVETDEQSQPDAQAEPSEPAAPAGSAPQIDIDALIKERTAGRFEKLDDL